MRRAATTAAVVLFATLGGGCGDWDDDVKAPELPPASAALSLVIPRSPANAKVRIRLGVASFTEQVVLGQLYGQALRAAGYRVDIVPGIEDEDDRASALRADRIDGWIGYTGVVLGTRFGVPGDEVPRSDMAAFADLRKRLSALGLVALQPAPFSSSNEVAVTRETARRYRLRRISDLLPVAGRLRFAGPPDCPDRPDCLAGLYRTYGLRFRATRRVPIEDRHKVLRDGRADVGIVFSADPQISRDQLVVLTDDLHMLPPNNTILVLDSAVAVKAGPALSRAVADASRDLTAEVVQELIARVDYDHQSPAAAVRTYLRDAGLVAR